MWQTTLTTCKCFKTVYLADVTLHTSSEGVLAPSVWWFMRHATTQLQCSGATSYSVTLSVWDYSVRTSSNAPLLSHWESINGRWRAVVSLALCVRCTDWSGTTWSRRSASKKLPCLANVSHRAVTREWTEVGTSGELCLVLYLPDVQKFSFDWSQMLKCHVVTNKMRSVLTDFFKPKISMTYLSMRSPAMTNHITR